MISRAFELSLLSEVLYCLVGETSAGAQASSWYTEDGKNSYSKRLGQAQPGCSDVLQGRRRLRRHQRQREHGPLGPGRTKSSMRSKMNKKTDMRCVLCSKSKGILLRYCCIWGILKKAQEQEKTKPEYSSPMLRLNAHVDRPHACSKPPLNAMPISFPYAVPRPNL